MLCRSIGMHSDVHGLRETHYFGDIWDPRSGDNVLNKIEARNILAALIAREKRDGWNGNPENDDYIEAARILAEALVVTPSKLFAHFARHVARNHGKTIAVEQTPRNVFYAQEILEKYPHSFIIEIVRDPRAVLYSQRQRWKIRLLGAKNVPFWEAVRVAANYHAVTMSHLWVHAIEAGDKLAKHPRVKRLRYEDLVNSPESTLREICVFLEFDFQINMMKVPRISSSTQTHAPEGAGITKESLDAWSNGLPLGDRLICERITRACGRRLGYQMEEGVLFKFPVLWHMLRYPLHFMSVPLVNPKRALIQLNNIVRR